MRTFNYSAIKDQKWDSDILGLIAAIYKYAGKQELYLKQKPHELEKLVEIAKVQSAFHGNYLYCISKSDKGEKYSLCLPVPLLEKFLEELVFNHFVCVFSFPYTFIIIFNFPFNKIYSVNNSGCRCKLQDFQII